MGRFDLTGIAPAQRGVPQIEVEFDIDSNGILHVSAKDKATGKEQRIEIKAGSGLTDEEVEQMVKDAELHAEEDKKFQETVKSRNAADAMVHSAKTLIEENKDNIEDGERADIEEAITKVNDAMKENDKEVIDKAAEALQAVLSPVMQKAQAAAQAGAQGEAAAEDPDADDDDVVDAEFEEVDEDKK